MPAPAASENDREQPLAMRVDGMALSACLDTLLAVTTPVTSVEVVVARSVGQGGDDVWLAFVTYHPGRGWERNGVVAEAPGMGAGRRLVVDLRRLAAAVSGLMAASSSRECPIEWRADALVVGGREVPASGETVPPAPEVPAVRDAVYLAGARFDPVTVESEQGRICIPSTLIAHLHQRGAMVAELGALEGEVYVVAQAERRAETSIDPVIVAPVELLMWSDEDRREELRGRRRQGGGEVEQLLAALDPATPVPVLLELLDTGVAYVRGRVAVHPALPATVIDELAATGTRAMRIAVAANRSLGPAAIELLARDPDPVVRATLATNTALLSAEADALAHDADVDVRAAAARHRALPPEVRVLLAADPAACVRGAVAADPASAPEVVRRLTGDDDPGVRRSAAANPACPPDVLAALVEAMPHAVLANPSVPESLLVDGARSVDGAVRAIVGANPTTPGRVLTALSRDPDSRVLRAVVTNPRAPAPARRRAEKRVMTDGETIVERPPG